MKYKPSTIFDINGALQIKSVFFKFFLLRIRPKLVKNGAGFTLIETVLYISITVIVLMTLVDISLQLANKFQRDKYISAVYSNSLRASERIRSEIRLATDIYSITDTGDWDAISLARPDPNLDPVVISVVDDAGRKRLAINYSGNGDVYLTDSNVEIDQFNLTNYSNASEKTQNVQFVLGVSTYNPQGARVINHETTVTTSVELIGI